MNKMKSTGIVRKVDELGRIVLPKELRNNHNINANDQLEFYVDDKKIILKKCESACAFCNSMDGITSFKGHSVCHECMKKIAVKLKKQPTY